MAAGSGSGDQWSSIWGFLLASVGFAVGMGNIWRFPYVLGENGGSAFLIIYLAFAIGIGLPLRYALGVLVLDLGVQLAKRARLRLLERRMVRLHEDDHA